MLMRPKNVDIYWQCFYGGHGQARDSTPFWLPPAAASGALQKRRQRQPTMENSVIAVEAMRRCRIWHMLVARAIDAH